MRLFSLLRSLTLSTRGDFGEKKKVNRIIIIMYMVAFVVAVCSSRSLIV